MPRGTVAPVSGVDDLAFEVGQHAADRRHPKLDRIVDLGLKPDRGGFGHAVADGDLRYVHAVDDVAHDVNRAWSAGHDSRAQRLKLDAAEAGWSSCAMNIVGTP